jgi:peptidyl-prolyl cis-trans isomerase C
MLTLGLLMPVACVFAQSTSAPTPVDTVLARSTSGVVVRWQDVLLELKRSPQATQQAMLSRPDSVKQLVTNIMMRRLLAEQAEKNGLGNDPELLASMTLLREKLLAEAQMQAMDTKQVPAKEVLEASIKEIYKAKKDSFVLPAQTRARHILLDAKAPDALDKAKALLAQLKEGASFEEAAKANSLDPASAAKGGDLGFFAAGRMIPEFEQALNKLDAPGQLSEPVLTQFGYHIIRLEERQAQRQQSLDEVHDKLAEEIVAGLQKEARRNELDKLNKAYQIDNASIDSVVKPGTP